MNQHNPLAHWWWTMDRTTILLLTAVCVVGLVAVTTASLGVARKYGVEPFHFAERQALFLVLSAVFMLAFASFNRQWTVRIAVALFFAAYVGVLLTFVMGVDVKGASRWLNVAGQSVQPTEFLKPAFILVNALILSRTRGAEVWQRFVLSFALMACVALPIFLQPNVGMVLLLGLVWGAQIFLAGLPWLVVIAVSTAMPLVFVAGYSFFPHVQSRIDRFLNPENADTYQVDMAREAFLSGHIFGKGPAEGTVKFVLPDAHTDFIFAVIGEEFGILTCLLLLALYAVIILRVFAKLIEQEDRFVLIAGGGLIILFSLQVVINASVALHILPTTGMTLPFVSYGGSSTLAMGIVMGLVLALLRREQGRVRGVRG